MPHIQDIIIAEEDKDFDKLLRKSALIAEFLTAGDSDRYSKKDARLRQLIEDTLGEILGPDGMEAHACVGYDWWPDHTRSLELDPESFRPPVFDALRALLVGEFDEWRIQAVIYRDHMDGTTLIGSVLIWSEKLIIDRALYDWMCEAGFGVVLSIEPRTFSLLRDDLESPRYNLMNDPQ